jgi:flagellar FliJ protein
MSKSTLATLIELAEKESDDAAKRLGFAIQHKDDAEKQLQLLVQYRADYEERLAQGANRGMNVTQFMNFRSFIVKLDQALDGQKKLILDAEYRVNLAKEAWQEIEKKRLSYQTLIDRSVKAALKKELKLDQKQTDEHATRSHFYKQLNSKNF